MDSLSWKYEDVINERLFADNLEIIPSKFDNDESWRRILLPYIFEDLRASLKKSLQEKCDKIKRSRIQFSERSMARMSTIRQSLNSEEDLEFQIVSDATNQEDLCGSLNILIMLYLSTFLKYLSSYYLIDDYYLVIIILRFRTGSHFENGDSLLHTAHSFVYIKSFDDENALFECSIFCEEISHFHSLLQDKAACDILLIQVPLVPALLAINHLRSFIPPSFFKDVLTAEYDLQNSTKMTYRNSLRSESVETLNASQRAAVEQIMNSTDSPAAGNPALELIHGPPGTSCCILRYSITI